MHTVQLEVAPYNHYAQYNYLNFYFIGLKKQQGNRENKGRNKGERGYYKRREREGLHMSLISVSILLDFHHKDESYLLIDGTKE